MYNVKYNQLRTFCKLSVICHVDHLIGGDALIELIRNLPGDLLVFKRVGNVGVFILESLDQQLILPIVRTVIGAETGVAEIITCPDKRDRGGIFRGFNAVKVGVDPFINGRLDLLPEVIPFLN